MAAGDVRRIIRARCQLIKDPTDFSAASPYGGTVLGIAKLVVWHIIPVRVEIPAEEFGGLATESIHQSQRGFLAASMRDRDPDALSAIFPGSSTGSGSGRNVVDYLATTERARLGSSRAHGLLVAPQDDEDAEALYMPLGEPMPAESAQIPWSLPKEWAVPAVWYALPSSGAVLYREGVLEDLTL